MIRACLLQFPGDPFIGAYWLRNYERVWADEVDSLQVFINGQSDPQILDFLRAEVERIGGSFSSQGGRLVHGEATRVLVESCTSDAVILMEDDAFVRVSGAVDGAFRLIEDGAVDVIGTPRGGMDAQIEAYANKRWVCQERPGGGSGPGLWPCFLFAKTADLMNTSRRFESWTWQVGETIPGLDYLVEERPQSTDTFTTTAFELRGANKQIATCVQHKELWDKDITLYPDAPWFHAGGLSNADFLRSSTEGPAGGSRPDLAGSNEGNDWAHRVWWWRRILDSSPDLFPDLQPRYRENLDSLETYMGIEEMTEAWTEKLLPWISWDDQA